MEPPGTAPGSNPLITSAFMSIVPKDTPYIGERTPGCKPGMQSTGCIENSRLRGLVEVGQYQPQRKDQLDSSENRRFDQGRVVQNDRHDPPKGGTGVHNP